MMKTASLIIMLSLLGSLALTAGIHDNAGEYGYQFLNISNNPISLALAGRGIHRGAELSSFMYQPAVGAVESHRSLGISHTAWLDDTKFNNVYYSYSNRISHFGLALRNLDYGSLENRDDNGFLIGYYSPLNLSLMGNYARRITPSIYAGANLGVVYEKLNTDSSVGVHSDWGLTLLPPLRDSKLSVAVRNLGLSSRMNEESTKLPLSFEADLSKGFDFENKSLTVEISGIKAIDDHWKATISTELELYGLVCLRGGYKLFYDAEDLTAGVGIRWQRFAIDYGWAAFNSRLNDIHSLGISYHF